MNAQEAKDLVKEEIIMPTIMRKILLQTFKNRIATRLKGFLALLFILGFAFIIANPFKGNFIDRNMAKIKIQKNLNSFAFYYTINPAPHLCNKRRNVVFVVPSRPSGFEARMAVRKTWANSKNLNDSNSSVVFLIGKEEQYETQERIFAESKVYGDILQANFIDSYYNLTLKSVIMLRWAATSCKNFDYLMKVDDDVYIYYSNLLRFLSTLPLNESQRRANFQIMKQSQILKNGSKSKLPSMEGHRSHSGQSVGGGRASNRFIVGHLMTSAKPIRDLSHKWFVGKDEFEGNVYPSYTLGACYLISGDLVGDLYSQSQKTPLFRFEDIYVTGLLPAKLKTKAKPIHNENFNSKTSFRCRHPSQILDHDFSPQGMIKFHKNLNNANVDMTCRFSIFGSLLREIG